MINKLTPFHPQHITSFLLKPLLPPSVNYLRANGLVVAGAPEGTTQNQSVNNFDKMKLAKLNKKFIKIHFF